MLFKQQAKLLMNEKSNYRLINLNKSNSISNILFSIWMISIWKLRKHLKNLNLAHQVFIHGSVLKFVSTIRACKKSQFLSFYLVKKYRLYGRINACLIKCTSKKEIAFTQDFVASYKFMLEPWLTAKIWG